MSDTGGYIRVEVDKWGKVSSDTPEAFEVNLKKNVSGIEYELK